MQNENACTDIKDSTEHIYVRGIVQGVGFRPTVWHLAQQLKLRGDVSNNGGGVLIRMQGKQAAIDTFVGELLNNKPALARIDSIDRQPQSSAELLADTFEIISSSHTEANTGVLADAALCQHCLDEIVNPDNRRYHYPFTNCTHCGPRLSIIQGVPYDRTQTTMAKFIQCEACEQEYSTPHDRRFHAQPNACPECGPQCWLTDKTGNKLSTETAVIAAAHFLNNQHIVAIKGIGGFHLAVDATDQKAVLQLRERKQRPRKPFAIMARDLAMIEQYCHINEQERVLLMSAAAPVVLLEKKQDATLAEAVAPGQNTLGFMLPYSPLHHLLLNAVSQPIILTSANIADEPQCIDNNDALSKLADIADYFLLHNRDIANRVDDSVVRVMADEPQVLRRGRGYAPHSLILAEGFKLSADVLAMGGELKNTFCMLKNGEAVLSQHMGDLENYATYTDYKHNIVLYKQLFQHHEKAIAVDLHPEYLSTKAGIERVGKDNTPLESIQHHHAHIASCLADNQYPFGTEAVLGIVLDGLGMGEKNELWGGEFLFADYENSKRLAHFRAIALIGGTIAMKQPWRNSYAHLHACLGWDWVNTHFAELDIVQFLNQKPLATFNAMLEKKLNCPLVSSAGRLFDAVAAAVGICIEHIQYEGQAAIELETCITQSAWQQAQQSAYPFLITDGVLDPAPMWRALLSDLANMVEPATISARFHKGLSLAIQQMATQLANSHSINTIALSGGVFQNKTLFEDVKQGLEQQFTVLTHKNVPANDGGLALGQAVIAATRIMRKQQCA